MEINVCVKHLNQAFHFGILSMPIQKIMEFKELHPIQMKMLKLIEENPDQLKHIIIGSFFQMYCEENYFQRLGHRVPQFLDMLYVEMKKYYIERQNKKG